MLFRSTIARDENGDPIREDVVETPQAAMVSVGYDGSLKAIAVSYTHLSVFDFGDGSYNDSRVVAKIKNAVYKYAEEGNACLLYTSSFRPSASVPWLDFGLQDILPAFCGEQEPYLWAGAFSTSGAGYVPAYLIDVRDGQLRCV